MLKVENICKNFGGVQALSEASIHVKEKSICALLGPNGSGKTTLFNVITGVYPADSGKVIFNGEDITGLKPYEIARKGLVRTFQITKVFRAQTVFQNMLVAPRFQTGESVFGIFMHPQKIKEEEAANSQKADELLELLELSNFKNDLAGNMSYGDQKKLEIARALMIDPKILLLDEPTAGVSAESMDKLIERILVLNKVKGTTFLIVEHRMKFTLSLAQYMYVLARGANLAEGLPQDVIQDPKVISAYLGEKKKKVV